MHQPIYRNFLRAETDQRASSRAPVAMGASCRNACGAREYVALIDLTAEGCCVLSRQPFLSAGQRVTLSPETLAALHGCVRWSDGCLSGVRFDRPLYGPVYEHLARTFAQQQVAAPQYGNPGDGAVKQANAFRREILRTIDEVEARDRPNTETEADRYNRWVRQEGQPRFLRRAVG